MDVGVAYINIDNKKILSSSPLTSQSMPDERPRSTVVLIFTFKFGDLDTQELSKTIQHDLHPGQYHVLILGVSSKLPQP